MGLNPTLWKRRGGMYVDKWPKSLNMAMNVNIGQYPASQAYSRGYGATIFVNERFILTLTPIFGQKYIKSGNLEHFDHMIKGSSTR
jgi:hypothetical protein